jgi:intermediate peptidase
MQGLNSNTSIYDALVTAIETRAREKIAAGSHYAPSEEDVEADRVAWSLRLDFERGGVHLGEAARARAEDLSRETTVAAMSFSANLTKPDLLGSIEVLPTTRRR